MPKRRDPRYPAPFEDEFWWKDLPGYTNLEDVKGIYYAMFHQSLRKPFDSEFNDIVHEYILAGDHDRLLINRIFVHLTGHRLSAIIEKAHGFDPDSDT